MTLRPEATPPGPGGPRRWLRRHLAGVACAAVGVAAVGVAALVVLTRDGTLTDARDPRLTVPFLILALAAAITSIARREGAYAIPIAGVALAASALVFGWVLVVALIMAATAGVIALLSELM